MTKKELQNQEENNMIALVDQSGVEMAMDKLLSKNNSLLPNNVVVERIKNSAGFYVASRKDLMELPAKEKASMLYGILKEAMVGCEAGTDYDIVPFKSKAVITRKKEGWFKIIDLIKPAEIMRFTTNVIFKGDDYYFNPVTEELTHKINGSSDKYDDIVGAYAYIKFANGFEKTIFMSRKDLDAIRKASPSASTSFSPWTSMPIKMVKTKVTKELAKDLFTLFSAKVNSTLARAINSDEVAVSKLDLKGNVIDDDSIYETEVVEEPNELKIKAEEVDINNL